MKKKILLCILIIIILYIVYYTISLNSISSKVINNLNKEIENYNNYIDSLNIKDEGEIEFNCKYKGAHGQFFPAKYTYNYEYKNNTLTLSNDKGYASKDFNFNITKLNKLTIKNKKYSFNRITITTNKYLITIMINPLGKPTSINIKDKNINISTNNTYKRYQGTINNKSFIFDKSNSNYYLNYNNSIKANILDKKINLVISNYSFNLEFENNGFIFNMNSPSSIYMAINSKTKYKDITINKTNKLNEDDIPLFRYINNMED